MLKTSWENFDMGPETEERRLCQRSHTGNGIFLPLSEVANKTPEKVLRLRTELLKDESTRNRYQMNLDLALKTVSENPSTSPEEIDIDTLVDKSPEIFTNTAETLFERNTGYGKPWITDEIIQLCKDKCAIANRQYPEKRDTCKYFK
ncbi:hypothetical protein QYM36_012226 [Artemia franciscana]|uniref:Uncharacterized protein n=1 Tax=Artemia franciscana TaxID=6661 RepID=A0AA88L7J5_ARTSF|nr:hypothetical protein QYM36_012226 [Artemia franciscana]